MRARRTDANQEQLVKDLRKSGYTVKVTSHVGEGFPDLVIAKDFKTMLVEVKDPDQPPSKRKLTPDEVKFHLSWNDFVIVAETINDIKKHYES